MASEESANVMLQCPSCGKEYSVPAEKAQSLGYEDGDESPCSWDCGGGDPGEPRLVP